MMMLVDVVLSSNNFMYLLVVLGLHCCMSFSLEGKGDREVEDCP